MNRVGSRIALVNPFVRLPALCGAIVLTMITSDGQAIIVPTTQPGTMCERIGGATLNFSDDGTAYNSDPTNSLTVLCPLVRDSMSGSTIVVHDRHPTKGVFVAIDCYDDDSATFYSNSTTTTGTGDYIWVGFPPLQAFEHGACFFFVTLPEIGTGASSVVSYMGQWG